MKMRTRGCVAILVASMLSACNGSVGDDAGPSATADSTMARENSTVVVQEPIVDVGENPHEKVNNFRLVLDESFTEKASTGAVDDVLAQLSKAIEPFNEISNIFGSIEIPVYYRACDEINAYYSSSSKSIVLCDELLNDAYSIYLFEEESAPYYGAFSTLKFVLYHEMGHAIDDLSNVSLGGNRETIADAIATVLSVRTGQGLIAAWGAHYAALGGGDGSVFDIHNSSADRSGNIWCWATGSSSFARAAYPETFRGFIEAGRDCVGEFADQSQFLDDLVPELRAISPIRSRK